MLLAEEKINLEKLPEESRCFIVARFAKPISQLTDFDIEKGCLEAVKDAVMVNEKFDKDHTAVIKNLYELLAKDLKKPKYKAVTIEEVKEGIYRGARQEYGSFFAVNLSTIISWVDAYLKSKERHEALNQFILISNDAVTSDVPVHLKIQRSKEGCIRYFNEYKEKKVMGFFAQKYYDFIKEQLGLKSLVDRETFNQIASKTTIELREEIESCRAKNEKKGFWKEVELMDYRLANLDKDQGLIAKQKTLMLKAFFDSLISQGKELELK